ncbi:MAG: hypothetical protein JWR65_4646, partial [Massilia sp.]|nr:hypothetical protein [Massilia sp.]
MRITAGSDSRGARQVRLRLELRALVRVHAFGGAAGVAGGRFDPGLPGALQPQRR